MADIINRQFCYTQQSLDTFVKCPLKFKKRYIEGLRWDSMPGEEAITLLERGNSFHLLACRYFSGIPYGIYDTTKDSELLSKWVRNLESCFEKRPEAVYLPEYRLRTQLKGFRLEANFDLITIQEGKVTVWDWKTHTTKANDTDAASFKKKLEKSLQTMVYLYVLGEQSSISGLTISADTPVSMKYWQPDPPRTIAEINHDSTTHESFRNHLSNLLEKVSDYNYAEFDKALYNKHCRYCEFNWYCKTAR